MSKQASRSCSYSVSGMHCKACEVLIEKKVSRDPRIVSANASLDTGILTVTYKGTVAPQPDELTQRIADDGYQVHSENAPAPAPVLVRITHAVGAVLLAVMVGLIISETGISSLVTVSQESPLGLFFVFGLIAGASTCAALVGGLLLSLSRQWTASYGAGTTVWQRFEPFALFNGGRIAGFFVFGGILGAIGQAIQLTPYASAILTIVVSLLMIVLALQMLDVPGFSRFAIALPKRFTRPLADERNFSGRLGPVSLGALTFFLPCGFTVVAQGVALASGDPFRGSVMMGLFALGTAPLLTAIGWGSAAIRGSGRAVFDATVGALVLVFAMYNLNAQFNVLGWKTPLEYLSPSDTTAGLDEANGLPRIENGKQIVDTEAGGYYYNPPNITVRAGVPVEWRINDIGTSGCTSAIIAPELIQGQIALKRGMNVAEFTAPKAGTYKFSCWMGMVTGTITAI
jgi:sulfite exporter TauE/SafE/copper chaperone CopZ